MTVLTGFRPVLRAALVLLATATGLGGCASNRTAPVLLTLPSAAPALLALPAAPATAPVSTARPTLLTLRRVTLPEYLISRRVRYRSAAATLAEWPNTYWAERIEVGVAREFGAALRQQLPGWTVCDSGCGDAAAPLALEVDVLALDFQRATQTLRAHARITLRRAGSADQPADQASDVAYEQPTAADTAPAHAQAIATVIRALAGAAALRVRAAQP